MTRDAKMASEGTVEPYENGTNDLAVQRSLATVLFNLFCYGAPLKMF